MAGRPPDARVRRIVLVAPNLSRRMGGEALKALQIHRELRAQGYAVRQVTHARVRNEMRADEPALDIAYVEDDPLQVFLHRARLKPALGLLNAWQLHRRARAEAAAFDADVVHFTSPISPVLPYFRMTGRATVIGPLNGNVTHPPAFAAREPLGKKLGAAILAPLQRVLGTVFRGKRGAELLVAGGERTERALRLGGCTPDRFEATLDSGVPDALLDRARFRHTGVNPRFVFFGRLVAYKGCDLAIRAVAASADDLTLDVFGDGPERARLEALAGELGVAGRVRFLGWIAAGPALYDRLGDYRALVMPSLAEANGIAFQEAMVLGLPVICIDWAGPRELLTGDEAVMIAPSGEGQVVAAIAAAMERLARDGAAADVLADRARAKAERLGFRWTDLLARWRLVYERAVSGQVAA